MDYPFTLEDEQGQPVLQKLTGEPFRYSTRTLAELGRKAIAKERKITVVVRHVGADSR